MNNAQDGLSSAMKQQDPYFSNSSQKKATPLSSSGVSGVRLFDHNNRNNTASKISIEIMGSSSTPIKPSQALGPLSSPLYQALNSPELNTLSSNLHNQVYREQPGSTHSDYTSSLLDQHHSTNSQMSSNSNSNLDINDLPGLVKIQPQDSEQLRSPPSSPLKARIMSTPQYISSPMKLLELASVCEER